MGLFSIFSGGSGETPAQKKKRIREQYDTMIEGQKRVVEEHKRQLAEARWQLKMTKDKAHKRTIENTTYNLKSAQEHLKFLKESKATALRGV